MWSGFVIGDRGLGASGDTHPAWMMAHAVAGPYLVVGASAVGQIHLARGAPRDDAFVVRAAGPWLAVAVADGVGSRPLSRYGATYVVEALSASLLRPLIPHFKTKDAPEVSPQSLRAVHLAPPSRAEEGQIKVGLTKIKSGLASLTAGMKDWTQGLSREEWRPATDFWQAASIGWWLKEDKDAHSEAKAPSPQGATHVGDQPLGTPTDTSHDRMGLIDVVRQSFVKTHLGLREHARSLGLELADLSCTALALLLNVETGNGAVGQVGDGAILGLTAQGKVLELVQPPDTGDPQTTYTLNKPNFERYLAPGIIARAPADPFVAFYVMTDGLSGDLLYSSKEGALEDWAQKVDHNLRASPSPAQAAAGMLNWLATYIVKGSWDDRTLVVITHQERKHGNRDIAAEQPEPAESVGDQ